MGEEAASSVVVGAWHCSTEDCIAVGHTLDCNLDHMALVEEAVPKLVAGAVEEALALKHNSLSCTAAGHKMESTMDHKASWLQSMPLSSIVGYKMVHMIEDSSVRIGCKVSQVGRWIVMVDAKPPDNQEHSSGSHIPACRYERTVDHKSPDFLVSWFSFCLAS